MQPSVLDSAVVSGLLDRLETLSGDEKPLWGRMSVTEMLHHCNLANQRVLSWDKPVLPASLKQKITKFVVLKLIPVFPKDVKTAPQFDTKGKINREAFDREKKLFASCLHEFYRPGASFNAPHPFFGPLDTVEWGHVVWLHVDHHLRQFGV
ncbi:Protein of unknown function [Cyclobacterium lianum]|uniref:DUF1569 domain-containing protein n=1 Tax=Cyclobacterium lianum TaxID=388280 RepID=A0A1M7KVR3_9BACT|nr:DUF1569 domain-containing protein [Cyclobacterium lianum]SHM69671.1 Protein of unknown function [Cyclobacterium lianum]